MDFLDIYKKNEKNRYFNTWQIVLVACVALFFGFFMTLKANAFEYQQTNRDTLVGDYDVDTAQYMRVITTATSTIYGVTLYTAMNCTDTGTYPAIQIDGTYNSESNTDTTDTPTWVTWDFDTMVTIGPGSHTIRLLVSTCTAKPRLYGIDPNPYSTTTQALFYIGTTPSGDQTTFPYLYVDDIPPPDTVQIIDLEIGEFEVTVESEQLLLNPDHYCYLNETCKIRLYYDTDHIGSYAWLLPQTEEDITNADDEILGLPGFDTVDMLVYDFEATIQSSEMDIPYYVYVSPLTASGTLLETDIHWIASTTDDITNVSWIADYFKNIFPVSIVIQIKGIFDDHKSTSSIQLLDVDLQDIIPVAHSGFSASGTILSASIIRNNFEMWNDTIYPYMRYFIWIITFIYVIIRLKSLATSSDTG